MVIRLKLAIEQEEYSALLKLAISELRNPKSQLLFILRQKLELQELLHKQTKGISNASEEA